MKPTNLRLHSRASRLTSLACRQTRRLTMHPSPLGGERTSTWHPETGDGPWCGQWPFLISRHMAAGMMGQNTCPQELVW